MTASANVKLVLATMNAYNAGNIDTFIAFYAPQAELFPDASMFPESGPVQGRDEWRSWIEDVNSAWIGAHWETTECYALGADRVLHRGQWGGEGAASGIETSSELTGVFTIRDGLISHVEFYFDHDRALKAAGLAPEGEAS